MPRSESKPIPTFSEHSESVFASFEANWKHSCNFDFNPYLMQFDEDQRAEALVELIRIDMELSSTHSIIKETRIYLERYPHLAEDVNSLRSLLFEEYRLKKAHGQVISLEGLAAEYGIKSPDWAQHAEKQHGKSGSIRRQTEGTVHDSTIESALESELCIGADGFPEIPSRFLRFELVGLLGQGAMGRVYLARQDDLANRFVALKVTRETTSEPDRLARLQHTNIVPVFSLHRLEKLQAICMPFLGLTTLSDLETYTTPIPHSSMSGRELISTIAELRDSTVAPRFSDQEILGWSSDGRTPPSARFSAVGSRTVEETFAWLFQQLAEGLSYAHKHGVLHGDIKPANILLSDDGHPLLLDFHLSQSTMENRKQSIVGGTLPFMSAEHLRAFRDGGAINQQCDLFSLGAVFYKLLSGECPYPNHSGPIEKTTNLMLLDRQHRVKPLRVRSPSIDPDLATIVEKCLEPSLADRYLSAEQVSMDLRRHI